MRKLIGVIIIGLILGASRAPVAASSVSEAKPSSSLSTASLLVSCSLQNPVLD
jgi:hypothetical protein